ncbi:MAG: hypothetical protein ACR2LI_16660 [Propionibacteriaceae bacterium]
MRRTVVAATLFLSCAVGAGLGVGLHSRWPDPFASPATTTTLGSTPGPPSALATPQPSGTTAPSQSPSTSPIPSPSVSSSPSPSPSASRAAPAFTARALLQPREFLERGWAVARQVDAYDTLPSAAITPCVTVDPDSDDLVAGYAATYASDRTTAAEVVARFTSTARAAHNFTGLRTAVAGCVDAPRSLHRLRITDSHRPTTSGVDEMIWWNTRPLDDGPDRGVVGIVRVDDRIALITLSSGERDPAVTTQITSLLAQAGLRLV